jgi:2,4-dichlorophenol 6-monooxygenase
MSSSFDADVLVVGAGPSGLTASALLARAEVSAITITKYSSTADTPRAHITNQRTVEVMRDLGVEPEVVDLAMPQHLMRSTIFATGFNGQELARTASWGAGPDRASDYLKASPSRMCNIPQHLLEPVIRDAALAFGADIRFNNELIDITQDDQGVTSTIRDRVTGEVRTLRSRYVIASDGGRSTVAEKTGIKFAGGRGFEAAYSLWLEADLSKYTRYRSGSLFFTVHPGMDHWLTGFICVKPWNEWVVTLFTGVVDPDIELSEEALSARVLGLIGDPTVDLKIKRVRKWEVNQEVAETYRQGRIFLAGDAAHRHPPSNGLGSNTSIQDPYNLVWKLALVLAGKADEQLLDTYDDERRPVGHQIVNRAMKSLRETQPLLDALGVGGLSAEDGQRKLDELFGPTDEGERRRAAMHSALELMNWQFNALGVELGQQYASSAVVNDGGPPPAQTLDPELYYTPSTYPGRYLPHVWLEHQKTNISTLDLCSYGAFTLIVGVAGADWSKAARKVATELDLPLQIRVVGMRQEYDDVWGDWTKARQVSDRGCILVRPDRYVAWRSADLPADGPEAAIRSVLTSITWASPRKTSIPTSLTLPTN